ncbi:hypothetical protein, partial [Kluyvera genomosp. 1]|uniref:hypothetical protein n=1 Tax=Kluyvera genomosp. 1 TaxID=2774053 RepID=UPI000ABEBB76
MCIRDSNGGGNNGGGNNGGGNSGGGNNGSGNNGGVNNSGGNSGVGVVSFNGAPSVTPTTVRGGFFSSSPVSGTSDGAKCNQPGAAGCNFR